MARARKSDTTRAEVRRIELLQNVVRNAINATNDAGRKIGVDQPDLKGALRAHGVDVSRLTIRAQRLNRASKLRADVNVWQDGELLFRLKLVPWDDSGFGARWHVKRHPDATWWRGVGRKAGARKKATSPADRNSRPQQAKRTDLSGAAVKPKPTHKKLPRQPRPEFSAADQEAFQVLYERAVAEGERLAAAAAAAEAELEPGTFIPRGTAALRLFDNDAPGFAEWLRQRGYRGHRTGIGQGARISSPGGVGSIDVAGAYVGGFARVVEEAGVGCLVEDRLD